MIASLAGWLAKSALMMSPVGGFLKLVPGWAWKLIGIAAVVGALLWAHQHVAHKALKKADAAGYQRAKDEDARALVKAHKDALAWKTKYDRNEATRSQKFRENTDAQIAAINRHADNLLRNGPGKARCGQVAYPGTSAGAGGSVASSRPGSAAAASLPPADGLAAVPWNWLVNTGGQCDLNRSEAQSWRDWYSALVKAWPKQAAH